MNNFYKSLVKDLIRIIFISLFILSYQVCNSQIQGLVIEGYVIDDRTSDPVVYANIYNFNTQSGTITISDGFFSINLNSFQDSIRISFIGYRSILLRLDPGKNRYIIRMRESSLEIQST